MKRPNKEWPTGFCPVCFMCRSLYLSGLCASCWQHVKRPSFLKEMEERLANYRRKQDEQQGKGANRKDKVSHGE